MILSVFGKRSNLHFLFLQEFLKYGSVPMQGIHLKQNFSAYLSSNPSKVTALDFHQWDFFFHYLHLCMFLLFAGSLATRDPMKMSHLQSPVRRHDGALMGARTWMLNQVTFYELTHYIMNTAGTKQIKMDAILWPLFLFRANPVTVK